MEFEIPADPAPTFLAGHLHFAEISRRFRLIDVASDLPEADSHSLRNMIRAVRAKPGRIVDLAGDDPDHPGDVCRYRQIIEGCLRYHRERPVDPLQFLPLIGAVGGGAGLSGW